jgi:hypothetical protein
MDCFIRLSDSTLIPGGSMPEHNPMQNLLRRHLGVDAFALDGDDTDVLDSWFDKPRRREAPLNSK